MNIKRYRVLKHIVYDAYLQYNSLPITTICYLFFQTLYQYVLEAMINVTSMFHIQYQHHVFTDNKPFITPYDVACLGGNSKLVVPFKVVKPILWIRI